MDARKRYEADLAALLSYHTLGGWLVRDREGLVHYSDESEMEGAGLEPGPTTQPGEVRWYRLTGQDGAELGEWPGRDENEARDVMDLASGYGHDHPCKAGECQDEVCAGCAFLAAPVRAEVVL